ncbi:MAG: hypothetical protein R3213_08655 [Flavobacteriaceae bacterium]|nr:hypothetical protein [Flavobacteriaceae bacterium]
MIYRFRVLLDYDAEEDVFRDLEISEEDTLEDLHNAITQSFGFDGSEMASFYVSNEHWDQGEEISLFDLSDVGSSVKLMSQTTINEVVNEAQPRLIYIYDFLSMWTFLIELGEIVEESPDQDYPNLMYVQGQIPDEAPEKQFESESIDDFDEFDDDLDVDDYSNLDFDENWN